MLGEVSRVIKHENVFSIAVIMSARNEYNFLFVSRIDRAGGYGEREGRLSGSLVKIHSQGAFWGNARKSQRPTHC